MVHHRARCSAYSSFCALWHVSYCILAALLLVPIIYLEVGLLAVATTDRSVKTTACAASILLDDALHGNITGDGEHYFLGTTGIVEQLAIVEATVTALANNLTTNARPPMQSLKNKATTVKSQLEVLASGNSNTSFSLTYTDPTSRSSLGTQINSSLGGLLGNPAVSGSLCGTLYSGVSTLDGLLTTGINALDSFNSTALTNSIGAITSSAKNMSDGIVAMDANVSETVSQLQGYVSGLEVLLVLFYLALFATIALTIVFLVLSQVLCKMPPPTVAVEENGGEHKSEFPNS